VKFFAPYIFWHLYPEKKLLKVLYKNKVHPKNAVQKMCFQERIQIGARCQPRWKLVPNHWSSQMAVLGCSWILSDDRSIWGWHLTLVSSQRYPGARLCMALKVSKRTLYSSLQG
jgi:hypothetical protein